MSEPEFVQKTYEAKNKQRQTLAALPIEEKIERLAPLALQEDIRFMSGAPGWMTLLFEKLTALKTGNARFAKLLEEYDEVNDKVHRSETRVDLLTEEEEEHLRKARSRIKDQIAAALRK